MARAPRRKTAADVAREQADRAAARIRADEGVRCPACGCRFDPDAPSLLPPNAVQNAERLRQSSAKLARQMIGQLDPTTWDMWLAPLTLVRLDHSMLELAGPPHLARWAEGRANAFVAEIASTIAGHKMNVRFIATPVELHPTLGEAIAAAEPSSQPAD